MLLEELKAEYNKLQRNADIMQKELAIAPEGRLHVSGRKGEKPRLYFFDEEICKEHPNGVYISQDQMDFAKRLAQKEYDEKMYDWLVRTGKKLKTLIKCYEHDGPEMIYNKLSDAKKEMIEPLVLPTEEYVNKWKSEKITNSNTYEKATRIVTENGEQVRSKSEKIIADKLKAKNVPYVYEPMVVLDDGSRVFPDFAVLNVRERKEYYIEHFGMMDNPEYCKSAIEKISKYEKNGIYIGRGLICTFETIDKAMDTNEFNGIIREYLL